MNKKIIYIATIFPEIFPGPLLYGVTKRALQNNIELKIIDLKQNPFPQLVERKYWALDDRPCGGGNGMIMRADRLEEALSLILPFTCNIYPSPRGSILSAEFIQNLAQQDNLLFLCGRYEGVDARFLKYYKFQEFSIGDCILTGGEIPVLAAIDAILRLSENTLNNKNSPLEESFSAPLLEWDQYTRPINWKNMIVPSVLLTGNHKEIDDYNSSEAIKLTHKKRSDLFNLFLLAIFVLSIVIGKKLVYDPTKNKNTTKNTRKSDD